MGDINSVLFDYIQLLKDYLIHFQIFKLVHFQIGTFQNRPEAKPNGAKLKLINHIRHISYYKIVASLYLRTFK